MKRASNSENCEAHCLRGRNALAARFRAHGRLLIWLDRRGGHQHRARECEHSTIQDGPVTSEGRPELPGVNGGLELLVGQTGFLVVPAL